MDMVFRALAIYLFLVIVFKVAGRRALLQMTSFDLILLLIISEATQQALLGEDFSVTGAMITITTLVVVDIIFGLIKKYSSSVENVLDVLGDLLEWILQMGLGLLQLLLVLQLACALLHDGEHE